MSFADENRHVINDMYAQKNCELVYGEVSPTKTTLEPIDESFCALLHENSDKDPDVSK